MKGLADYMIDFADSLSSCYNEKNLRDENEIKTDKPQEILSIYDEEERMKVKDYLIATGGLLVVAGMAIKDYIFGRGNE